MLRWKWPAAGLSAYLTVIALLACVPLAAWMAWQTAAEVNRREQRLSDDMRARARAVAAAVEAEVTGTANALAVLVASGWYARLPDSAFADAASAGMAKPAEVNGQANGNGANNNGAGNNGTGIGNNSSTDASETTTRHIAQRTALTVDPSLLRPGWLGLFVEPDTLPSGQPGGVGLEGIQVDGSGAAPRVALSVAVDQQRRLGVWISAQHWQTLLERAGAPPTGYATLFDGTHRIVARTLNPSTYVGQQLPDAAVVGMGSRPQGVQRTALLEGPTALAAWQLLPWAGWGVGVGMPSQPVEHTMLASMGQPAGVAAICLLVGVALALRVARQVAAPLARLAGDGTGRLGLAGPLPGGQQTSVPSGRIGRGDAGQPEDAYPEPRSPVREIGALQSALERSRLREASATTTLERRAREFEAVFDASPVALAICLDAQCRHTRHNRAMKALLASGPNTATLRRLLDGRPIVLADQPLARAARGGHAVPLQEEEWRFPPSMHSKWLLVRAEPLVDEHGVVQGAVESAVDVTALKSAQQGLADAHDELARAQQFIDAAQMAAGIGFFHYDYQRDVFEGTAGHAAVLQSAGLEAVPASCALHTWLARFSPQQAEQLQAMVDALGAHEGATQRVVQLGNVGLARRHLTVRMQTSQEAAVPPRTLTGVVVDSSDQQLAEQSREQLLAVEQQARLAAEAASLAKDSLLNMLGHELRNPLNALSAAGEVLKLVGTDDLLARDAQEVIERQGRELTRLVDEFLDMARVTSRGQKLKLAPLDLAALAREAVATSGRGGALRQLPVVADAPAWIDGDRERLLQMLRKIVEHAASKTSDLASLSLTIRAEWSAPAGNGDDNGDGGSDGGARPQPSAVVRLVMAWGDATAQGNGHDIDAAEPADDGTDAENQNGQAASAAGEDSGNGNGNGNGSVNAGAAQAARRAGGTDVAWNGGATLGLEWVASLVVLHGARLVVDNRADGGTINVLFQAVDALDPAQARKPAGPDRPRTVLIVEDNDDAARAVQLALELVGHRVEVAFDGRQGLDALMARPPEVAIIDIGLPVISGLVLGRQARAAGYAGRMLAVSGYAEAEGHARALKAGFDGYMVKPLNIPRLRDWMAERAE